MPTNDIFEIINNRRSIRKFIDKEIPPEILEQILKAGFKAPFAYQICSIVYTSKKEKMKKLKHMGVYPTTQVLMIFILDFNRLEKILTQRGHTYDYDDGLLLWIGLQDVSLVAENLILAAEAVGLGSVLLGGAPLLYQDIKGVFNLPKKAFPVVGLCLGYPDPNHLMDVRPRFPLEHSAFEDNYPELTDENIQQCMKAMDEGYLTQGYYIKQNAKVPLKKGKDTISMDKYSWSEHISRKISQGPRSKKMLIDILKEQGFKL